MRRCVRMWIGSPAWNRPVGAVFAVVLPEAGIAEAPLIKDRMMVALNRYASSAPVPLAFSYGAAALERDGNDSAPVEAGRNAQCRRALPGLSGPFRQRATGGRSAQRRHPRQASSVATVTWSIANAC